MLRSSTTPDAILALSHAEWQAFLAQAKKGMFGKR
jgi:hypothetical protein